MKASFWVPMLALLLLVGFSAAVRSVGTGVALRTDESFSWRVATRPTIELLRDVARDTHPPGHFVLLRVWQKLFGSSTRALRSLSGVCGGLTVLFVYVALRSALAGKWRTALKPSTLRSIRFACLFAGGLAAAHAGLVGAGQTARMYALAALMAAITAWLVLRGLHDVPGGRRWWWAYGLGVSAMLYAHHYAWFTLAAQMIFVLGVAARRGMNNARDGLQTAGGLLQALGLTFAVYSLWLFVFLEQAHRVRQGFWVPAASADETCGNFLNG